MTLQQYLIIAAVLTLLSEHTAMSSDNSIKLTKEEIKVAYLDDVARRIKRTISPPKGTNDQALATVSFTMREDGEVEKIEIEKSSNSIGFDQSVCRAIQLATPYKPVPKAWGSKMAQLRSTIHWVTVSVTDKDSGLKSHENP